MSFLKIKERSIVRKHKNYQFPTFNYEQYNIICAIIAAMQMPKFTYNICCSIQMHCTYVGLGHYCRYHKWDCRKHPRSFAFCSSEDSKINKQMPISRIKICFALASECSFSIYQNDTAY